MRPPHFVRLIKDIWCLAKDDSITVEIERCGKLTWDQTFAKIIAALQRQSQTGAVLDVGAYIGDSTRWFTEHGFQTVAFEAQRDAFLCLTRNCPEANSFNFPVGNGERVTISGEEAGNMGARTVRLAGAEGVPTLRIDDLAIEKVACIKIDVEGWEPEVLAGATQTIARDKPIIVAEINPGALARHGAVPEDIFKHLPGWKREEIYRYYQQNWDIMFLPV